MKKFIYGIIAIVLIAGILSIFVFTKDKPVSGAAIASKSLSKTSNQTQESKSSLQSVQEPIPIQQQEKKESVFTFSRIKNVLFRSKFNKGIIEQIIQLREASKNKDKTQIASFVTSINNFVESKDSVIINDPWQNIIECVYDKCGDDLYLRLIDAVVLDDNDKQSNLIHYIIQSALFWNSKNTLFFSETLSNADSMVKELHNEKILQQWGAIIECDGNCADFYERVFAIVKSVAIEVSTSK